MYFFSIPLFPFRRILSATYFFARYRTPSSPLSLAWAPVRTRGTYGTTCRTRAALLLFLFASSRLFSRTKFITTFGQRRCRMHAETDGKSSLFFSHCRALVCSCFIFHKTKKSYHRNTIWYPATCRVPQRLSFVLV